MKISQFEYLSSSDRTPKHFLNVGTFYLVPIFYAYLFPLCLCAFVPNLSSYFKCNELPRSKLRGIDENYSYDNEASFGELNPKRLNMNNSPQRRREQKHKLKMKTGVMIRELIIKNRSCRRFHQDFAIRRETIKELIDLARLSASGANMQPLKYIISCNAEKNAQIFPHLVWAGYLTDWQGPSEGEKPAGYIIILGDTEISSSVGCDHGIAAQSILLGAAEKGLGGCMIGSIKREELRKTLKIPDSYKIQLVIALGKPKEKVVIDPVGSDGSIKYWRDKEGVHHVPKRALDDIILD